MSIGTQLAHRCTIERPVSIPDAYNARRQAWQLLAEQVPCRLITRTQQAPLSELAERPISTRYTLLLLPTSDIRITDRVRDIGFEDGGSDAGMYTVASVIPRRQAKRGVLHLSVELEKVGT